MAKFYLYNNNIYKYRINNHDFLLMTGWDKIPNHDRRIPENQLDIINLMTKLKTPKALELINKYWDSVETTWEFNGRTYDNLCSANHNQPIHSFVTKGWKFDYVILWHQGHIYWAYANTHYYPRMELHRFVDINTEPSINDFTKWTDISHCRAVRDVKTGKII